MIALACGESARYSTVPHHLCTRADCFRWRSSRRRSRCRHPGGEVSTRILRWHQARAEAQCLQLAFTPELPRGSSAAGLPSCCSRSGRCSCRAGHYDWTSRGHASIEQALGPDPQSAVEAADAFARKFRCSPSPHRLLQWGNKWALFSMGERRRSTSSVSKLAEIFL